MVIEVGSLGEMKLLDNETLVFRSHKDGSITIINVTNGKKIYSNTELSFQSETFKNLIVMYEYNFTTVKSEDGLFDWHKNKLLWINKEYSFLRFVDDKLFNIQPTHSGNTQSSNLSRVDLASGIALWDRGFEANIAQLIGIYKNQFILSFKDQILMGVDIETGSILWKIQNPQEIKANISRNAHLDLQTGKIYFLTSNAFVEFDIQTANMSRTKSFWTGNHQTSWYFGHSCKQDDYLYFTAGIDTAPFYYWLGVFHIPSMEIVWKYQREDFKETFNSAPKVDGDKLFALDSGGKLHIFEKEK